ncbi:APC family permease [Microbacterium sp. 5K110]|uniref:APC family permease n=1 Tax=unclassified Microbacterium TaxID=2609290 RepID=UPI0014854EA5|nr:APC family permease [Microbacterium sp. 5K110]
MSAIGEAFRQPQEVPGVSARNELHGLRRRTVSQVDIVAQSVASVAPVMWALSTALVTGVVAEQGAWISIILAAAISWGVARSFGEFGSRLAGSGSLFTFVARSGFRYVALVVALLLCTGYGTFAMAGLSLASGHMLAIVSSEAPSRDSAADGLTIIVFVALICLGIIVMGVRVTTRVTLVTESVGLVLLALLIVVALMDHGAPVGDLFSLHGVDWAKVSAGTVVMVGGWLGFESSAALGAEARRPLASVPRAMTLAVLLAAGVYLAAWFAQLAQLTLDRGTNAIVHLSLAMCLLAAVTAFWTALTRLFFLFGREVILPSCLGRTHPRLQTPHIAAIASFVPVVCGAVIFNTFGISTDALEMVAAPALMLSYVIATAVLIVFLARLGELTAPVALLAGVSALLMATVLAVDLKLDLSGGSWLSLATVVGACAAGWAWWSVLRSRRPNALDDLGMYDSAIAADVLGAESRSN